MTGPSTSADLAPRLVVVDHEKKCLEFHGIQSFYRAIELLENEGKRFFICER
jgi:hypothetical protein